MDARSQCSQGKKCRSQHACALGLYTKVSAGGVYSPHPRALRRNHGCGLHGLFHRVARVQWRTRSRSLAGALSTTGSGVSSGQQPQGRFIPAVTRRVRTRTSETPLGGALLVSVIFFRNVRRSPSCDRSAVHPQPAASFTGNGGHFLSALKGRGSLPSPAEFSSESKLPTPEVSSAQRPSATRTVARRTTANTGMIRAPIQGLPTAVIRTAVPTPAATMNAMRNRPAASWATVWCVLCIVLLRRFCVVLLSH